MDINGATLAAQYERAVADWPFVHAIEAEFGLPDFMMFAIGSKETNLRNIEGDVSQRPGESSRRAHGFGVIQRDIQHGIPDDWMDNIEGQFRWGAEHLVGKIEVTGSLARGVVAYNGSGQDAEDYGVDVLQRREFLAASFSVPTITKKAKELPEMITYDIATPDGNGQTFLLRSQGKPVFLARGDDVKVMREKAGVPHAGEISVDLHVALMGQ